MQLSDFFAPFNFTNVSILVLVLIIFDSVGVSIARVLSLPKFLRTVYWIFGMSIFVAFLFVLHFFFPYWPEYIWVILIAIAIPTIPGYLKNKSFLSLIKQILSFPYPILFLFLVFKPLFFKISLPPYLWDEMAYHYYSPAKLYSEQVWQFISPINLVQKYNFYIMLPRFLETAFIAIFSITKTYATARAIHFLVFFSPIYSISIFLKKNVGPISSVTYSFLALYLNTKILFSSTAGYIDVGAAMLAVLFMVVLIGLLLKKRKEYLYASGILFALAASVKYTVLGTLLSSLIAALVVYILLNFGKVRKNFLSLAKSKNYIKKIRQTIVVFLSIILIFGGYWYLKNLLITGNPVYPFVFQCKSGLVCGKETDVLAERLTAFSQIDLEKIINIVFQKNELLYQTTIGGLLLSFALFFVTQQKKRALLIFPLIITLSVLIEFKLSTLSPGFIARFNLHWPLLVPLAISLPAVVAWKSNRKIFVISVITLNIFAHFLYQAVGETILNNIQETKNVKFIDPVKRNYSRYRLSLDEWIELYLPEMNNFIKWCGEDRPMTEVFVADPPLIWTSYEGLMRVFLVNCNLKIIPLPKDLSSDGLITYANSLKEDYNNRLIVSLISCNKNQKNPYDKEILAKYYTLNQELICKSKIISPGLYKLSND